MTVTQGATSSLWCRWSGKVGPWVMGWWEPQSRTKGGYGSRWGERAQDLGPGLVGSTWSVISAFLNLGFSTWRFKGDNECKECVKHADRRRLLSLS